MTTDIIISNLGNLIPSNITYSEASNAFLSQGYVSPANNTYFNALRFAEGIVIKEDVGQGYSRTFLNGLRIYSLKDKVLLADKSFHSCFYSKQLVLQEAKSMLIQLINEAAQRSEQSLNQDEVITCVCRILNEAFQVNQVELIKTKFKNRLT